MNGSYITYLLFIILYLKSNNCYEIITFNKVTVTESRDWFKKVIIESTEHASLPSRVFETIFLFI